MRRSIALTFGLVAIVALSGCSVTTPKIVAKRLTGTFKQASASKVKPFKLNGTHGVRVKVRF